MTTEDKTAPVEPPMDLDAIKRLYPPDIKPEEFKLLVKVERENRAAWTTKQESKGKEE